MYRKSITRTDIPALMYLITLPCILQLTVRALVTHSIAFIVFGITFLPDVANVADHQRISPVPPKVALWAGITTRHMTEYSPRLS
jgi:H+/gluconate symporter-like permease